jgi:type IV pilus assembly protein PilC
MKLKFVPEVEIKDFRVTGKNNQGMPVQAVITVKDKKEAKDLLQKRGIIIEKLEQKREFNYYIVLPNKKKISGKKMAFNAQELKDAFIKHGYNKVRVEAVLIDIKLKPPVQSILQFINLSSFMLQEKMAYDKILEILADEEDNPTLRSTLKSIQSELKKGREGEDVFKQYEDVFGKFPAYMLGLATKSGNMAEVYEATAKFMERELEYKKNLKSALMTPAFTVLAMILAVLYYVISVFPATANLFVRFGLDIPPMTRYTLMLSDYLQVNWWWMLSIIVMPILVIFLWFKTEKGSYYRDKWMLNIPILGPLFHKTSIEIFFRVFAAIYSGAENNIETLKASAEACKNNYIEKGVKEIAIPMMLKDGASLVPALAASKVFNRTTLNRLKTGAETGNVLASASQIAKFFEQETTYKMNNVILNIQNLIGAFIGIVITLLTVVSSEIAMVSPKTPGM